MRKNFSSATAVIVCTFCTALLCSCGVMDWIGPSTETTASETSQTTTERTIETTKTATYGNVDEDDEGIEGYTSSVSITGGTLENDYSRPDLYDDDVRATMTTTTTVRTYYTTKSSATKKKDTKKTEKNESTTKKTTTETTSVTTEFKADSLYPMVGDMVYSSEVKYKVTSDTTYLNLRFGPSKEYDIQLRIPDGEYIVGTGETTGPDGNDWVYVSYNGTEGWVMRGLLEKQE